MAFIVSTDLKNGMLDHLRSRLSGGKIKFYTGVQPLGGNPVTSQVLVGEVVLASPCGPSSAAGQFNLFNPGAVASTAAGNTTWARLTDSSNAFLIDCDVTLPSGSGQIKITNTNISFPGTIDVETIEYFVN